MSGYWSAACYQFTEFMERPIDGKLRADAFGFFPVVEMRLDRHVTLFTETLVATQVRVQKLSALRSEMSNSKSQYAHRSRVQCGGRNSRKCHRWGKSQTNVIFYSFFFLGKTKNSIILHFDRFPHLHNVMFTETAKASNLWLCSSDEY